jgi:hypothetical protein
MFEIKVVERIKIHILCSVTFFSKNRAICELIWKNMVEPERLQMAMWWCFACWISKATIAQASCPHPAPTNRSM